MVKEGASACGGWGHSQNTRSGVRGGSSGTRYTGELDLNTGHKDAVGCKLLVNVVGVSSGASSDGYCGCVDDRE